MSGEMRNRRSCVSEVQQFQWRELDKVCFAVKNRT